MRKRWKVDYSLAAQMFEDGKTVKEIAMHFNVQMHSVHDGFRRRGILLKRTDNPVSDTLSDTDIAYLAGLFDGEGSININRKDRQFWLTVDITSTDKSLIDWLTSTVGGHTRVSNRANKIHKTAWHWTVCAKQAAKFLTLLLPYLRIKQDEAKIGLLFQSRMRPTNRLADKEIACRTELKRKLESLR